MASSEVTVEEFEEITPKKAAELASVCRGQFGTDKFKNFETWTHLLTIRHNDTLVAFLLLDTKPWYLKKEEKGKTAIVRYICVKEKGSDHARLLFTKAEELANKNKKTLLKIDPINPKVADVYKSKYGFTEETEDPLSLYLKKDIGGSSRLQKQTRRAKRNTRNNKGRKLRKLTTRRR